MNKIDEFAGLIESTKAEIVFGTESWLIPSINNSEVFPSHFNVYRKDRARTGGGVFLLVHSSLRSSELDIGHDDVESVWCTVTLADNMKFIAGTFYRPPNSDPDTLQQLYDIIYRTSDQFILAGDFNLPDLTWYNGTCIALTGCRENISMKNIIDTFGLTQYVTVATRNNNILDLLFCNSPNIVDSLTCIPGISDHLAVVATIKHVIKRPKPRQSKKVYFYDKADYSAISQE